MNANDLNRSNDPERDARGNAAKNKAMAAADQVLPKCLHTVRIIELVAREWMRARSFKAGDVYPSEAVLAAAHICGYPRATVRDVIVARVIKTLTAEET
jgi:hypothetical protein